jgi:hypothetical protein
MPVLSFLISLVLGFIIWRVCVKSTCQTHLFPCHCFDQYWFERQLNRYSRYSLLLCVVSVGLYIEFMPATVILNLCLTFVFVTALQLNWESWHFNGIYFYACMRVWWFKCFARFVFLQLFLIYIQVFLIFNAFDHLTALNYRPLYIGMP